MSNKGEIIKVKMDWLSIHPIAEQIYSYRVDRKPQKLLAQLMKIKGQLEPIIITEPEKVEGKFKSQIISGGRRYLAARMMGLKTMNAVIVELGKCRNEEEYKQQIRDLIVFHNSQRVKTYKEIINEAEAILGIIGKNQGARTDLLGDGSKTNPWGKIGEDRFEIAAKVVGGISGSSLRRLIDVVDFERKEKGNKELGLVERIVTHEISIARGHSLMKDFQQLTKDRAKSHKIVIAKDVSDKDFKLFRASSAVMKDVKAASVQLVMTSPPYYKLRTYGNATGNTPELGSENTPQEFIKNLVEHLKDVKRYFIL